MLETALAALLGFATALFAVMLAGPMIGRRISQLTWKQAEASLPMTMNEIAADRDRLRAEHAMAARRLEMQREAADEKLRIERVTSVRQADQITALDRDLAIARTQIERQSVEIAALSDTRAALETQLAETNANLAARDADLIQTRSSLQTALRQGDSLSATVSAGEVERVALETRIDTLAGELDVAKEAAALLRSERTDLRSRVKMAETQARLANGKVQSLEKKLEQAARRYADLEARQDRIVRSATAKPASEKPVAANAIVAKPNLSLAEIAQTMSRDQKPTKAKVKSFKPEAPVAASVDGVAQFETLRPKLERAAKASVQERAALKAQLFEISAQIVAEAALEGPADSALSKQTKGASPTDAGLAGAIARARDVLAKGISKTPPEA